jgi:tetratricopeptide (TPR) repeat protein
VVLAVLGVASWRQTGFWSDDVALWTRALQIDPEAGVAHLYRSKALEANGEREAAVQDLGSSIAIAQSKGYYRLGDLLAERARLLVALGRCDQALGDVEHARALPFLSPPAKVMLGETVRSVGEGRDCGDRKP